MHLIGSALNVIAFQIPELFAYKDNDLCAGEKINLNWDAYNISKVNIIHSINAGNNIDTVAINYNAYTPPYEYGVTNVVGVNSFIIQDAANNIVADTINVIVHPKPTITVSNDTAICDGHTITLKASTNGSGNTYLWEPGNLSGSIINVTPANSATSTYTVNVTTQYSCKNSKSVKVISELSLCPNVSINNILEKNKIVISCDNDFVTIIFLSDKADRFDNLYLSDISGKIVYEEKSIILYQGEKKQISVNSLTSGVYILTLYNSEKSIRSKISIIR